MFKNKLSKKDILIAIKNIFLVIIGTVILAFATGVFLFPFQILTGGISGLAIILDDIYVFEMGSLKSYDIYVFVITWGLFILGLFILGKNFAIKTLVSTIVYSPIFSLSVRLVENNVFNGFFNIAEQYPELGVLLGAVFGGAFVGAGCAIAFLGGGTTGGTDVIAFVICKWFKRLRSSVVIFIVDVAVVLGGIFALKDLSLSLLGTASAFICAVVIDKLFLGESQAFIAHIVSNKYEDINNAIIDKLDRTSTILDGTGGYSKEPKKVVMVSFSMREYTSLISIVNNIDRSAFITVSRAHEINGEGWSRPSPDPEKE
jgi:uncharacterized membrane-anchored protein YitT (DUF2179 family)